MTTSLFFWLREFIKSNIYRNTIVSGEFWEAIGGRINRAMDYKVGTAEGQSKGLQVLGLGEPWPIYLEGIE